MDRRLALATSAAVVLTVSAGTAAVAANLGLLSSTPDDTVGQLEVTRAEQAANAPIIIEEYVTAEGEPVDGEQYAVDGEYDDEWSDDEAGDDEWSDDQETDEQYAEAGDDEDDSGHDDDD